MKDIWYCSASQLQKAYSSGTVTPTQVAETILNGLDIDPSDADYMKFFVACYTSDVLEQAALSTAR